MGEHRPCPKTKLWHLPIWVCLAYDGGVDRSNSYLTPYQIAAAQHGGAFETTLWNSPKTQRARFEVIAQLCPMSGSTIIDAGCGRGDLLDYLIEIDRRPRQYIGVDALEEMVAAALEKKLPHAEFVHEDFFANPTVLRRYQPAIIVYSGSLNTMDDSEFFLALNTAVGIAEIGVIFNFLSTRFNQGWVDDSGIARRHPPDLVVGKMLEWDLNRIELRHDYLEDHDCTIAAWKSPDNAAASAPGQTD